MKVLKIALSTVAVLGLAATTHAQDSGAYVNLGVSAYEFDAYGIDGKVGYNVNEYFGAEVQGAFGIIDDEETIGDIEIESEVDYTIGAFGVLRYPVLEQAELFVRGGYQFVGVSAEGPGFDFDDDIDGFAIGGGGQYFWDDVNGVRLEYTYFDGENGGDLDTVTLSYVRKF